MERGELVVKVNYIELAQNIKNARHFLDRLECQLERAVLDVREEDLRDMQVVRNTLLPEHIKEQSQELPILGETKDQQGKGSL